MCGLNQCPAEMCYFMPFIIVLAIWEGVWKVVAMWKSARNNHLAWFICIALINTVGILPIIYIIKHRKPHSPDSETD